MTAKHTGGLWKINDLGNKNAIESPTDPHNEGKFSHQITSYDDNSTVIASIHQNIYDENYNYDEAESNARLIAAAPDLLRACEFVNQKCTLYGASDQAREFLDTAIRKARGE